MGTSSSHSGPGDGPSLLPSWASGGGNVGGDGNGDDGGSGPGSGESPGDDGKEADSGQAPGATGIGAAPTTHWRSAKSGMTRYARSGGGGGGSGARSAGSGYVRAKGGSRRAAAAATSGRAASRHVGNFLSSAVRSGIQQALASVGLKDVVGQSSERVLARLVDALAPAGSTKEEAAARRATIEVLEFLYERVIGEDGDLVALEQMNQETVEEAIERSVSGYIYNRWLEELGLSVEKGAVTEEKAVRLEQEVKTYVESCVALELGGKTPLDIEWGGRDGRRIIDQVYRDAYAVLEAAS